jgi:hypothetical protein
LGDDFLGVFFVTPAEMNCYVNYTVIKLHYGHKVFLINIIAKEFFLKEWFNWEVHTFEVVGRGR